MKEYEISLCRNHGAIGTTTAKATYPAVALKRVLDGGHAAGYKYASIGTRRVTLNRGDSLTITIKRL